VHYCIFIPQIVQAIMDNKLLELKSILRKNRNLVQKVDEATFATDDNVVNTAVTAHRFDIAEYLLWAGFKKPPSGVTSIFN